MKSPYENFIRIELVTLVLVLVIGLFSIFKDYLLLMLLSLYLLAVSIICEAMVDMQTHHKTEGIKRFVKGLMLLLLTTILLFQL